MSRWKRYVVGPDEEGRSAVLDAEQTNVQENPGFFWRCTVWGTEETPADNTIDGDRSLMITTREPMPGGMLFRNLEIPPDTKDTAEHIAQLTKLSTEIKQTVMPSEEDLKRHPSMHRTNTLDVITCVIGEIYLVTDVDEVLMTPGDTVVIRGTNHAWSNRSDKPALLSGVMVDAVPKVQGH
ncbi:cupin domain-containing protein [Glaciibacter flavus]|uniref:Cupin domain-containing protein n=1 Tax=Orlajensenia flava TaxID=2565934 RepID=A0A4S4FU92_9MICO|nr:cupin domain-containing protein [Glaciibacter flavus]THG33921.1 cupin domain-containing protein [Glaciibacter flavus]